LLDSCHDDPHILGLSFLRELSQEAVLANGVES
jgi:hypothetical protein